MPPPGRAQETWEDHEQRFPILEGQERKEAKKRAQVPVAARVDVVRPSDTTHACEGLTADEKIECPLHDPKAVVSISDLPRGARVTIRPAGATPEKVQQLFACHKSLAVVRPQAPTACTFFDARTDAEVAGRDGHITVDIERVGDVNSLRQQVRTALGPHK
jgi:hypothetical protein